MLKLIPGRDTADLPDRILDRYDLLYHWKRPEPGLSRRVPEATYPDEVWHVDLMYLWVEGALVFLGDCA